MSNDVIAAHDDETLDSVLFRQYGSTAGVEDLMMSDKSLVQSLHLRGGTAVTMPSEITTGKKTKTNDAFVNLWD
ncbi:MAG: hypothetical protein CR975_02050 [Gammaproteobacteria bacterium]|nr:MAG: hypothetical protein CR975_02050 [Gammaproteobacteria bacterium]